MNSSLTATGLSALTRLTATPSFVQGFEMWDGKLTGSTYTFYKFQKKVNTPGGSSYVRVGNRNMISIAQYKASKWSIGTAIVMTGSSALAVGMATALSTMILY